MTFLQGYVTNDVSLLRDPHDAQFTSFLNTKGRTIAEATLCVPAPHTSTHTSTPTSTAAPTPPPCVILDVEHTRADALITHLRRYKLRSKFEIQDLSESHCSYAFLPRDPFAVHPYMHAGEDKGVALLKYLRHALGARPALSAAFVDPRTPRLGVRVVAPTDMAFDGTSVQTADTKEYNLLRMLLGVPEGEEVTDAIPLEWNLTFLNGVSFDKGCYLGQELVARTHFRGLIRKRYVPVYFSAPGAPPRPAACADPIAVISGRHESADNAPIRLPFSFLDRSWRGQVPLGDPLSCSAAEDKGLRLGKITAWLPGTNIGMALVRLEGIAHTLPPPPREAKRDINRHAGPEDEGGESAQPASDAVDAASDVPGGKHGPGKKHNQHCEREGHMPDVEDFTNDETVQQLKEMHARIAAKDVDLKVGEKETQAAARATPVLPMFWRHIAHSGIEDVPVKVTPGA